MLIKDKFELLNQIPNLLNVPPSTLKTYEAEENSPRHIFTFLTLKQKHIKHFTKDKIFKFIGDVQERENVKVINFEKYPLAVTLNGSSKNILINLKPFDVEDVASLNPNDLFAAVMYGYGFSKLINKQFKIKDEYAKPIIDFLTSLLVRALWNRIYG